MEGLISKIQRYSTKDGPGLRTTVFLIGCNLSCLWCANPELIAPGEKYLYYRERCVGCGKCVSVAADNSITLTEKGCVIDRSRCSNLKECASSCYYDAYEKVGYAMTASDLCEKLKRDKDFYDQSGGGVTFSGGEPALQPEFVMETAKLLRREGIHTALETAGLIKKDRMRELIQQIDLVLYDIKAMDSKIHLACTGVDNRVILDNAMMTAEMNIPMIIRLIVVPGYNDDKNDFYNRLQFIKRMGKAVKQIDILKYHRLGEGKYLRLGLENRVSIEEPSNEYISEYVQMAREMGFEPTIGG
ncbi:MAG: glycyl-radical enzyme activating protein [Caldicoprobacterales bacterium]|jgi:pyruvate formate lyase activating enzyme